MVAHACSLRTGRRPLPTMSRFRELHDKYLAYYATSYPFQQIYKWLSYDGTIEPSRREWSYEGLTNIEDKSYVKRHVSISSAQQLSDLTRPTDSEIKLKFDIGPVYTRPMDTRYQKIALVPEQREFVFDIDADDFGATRHCCTGAQMCNKCWRFMECAACVIILFTQVYRFEKYMFCFSGRRGLHCWIVDKFARTLNQRQRLQLLHNFEIIRVDNKDEI